MRIDRVLLLGIVCLSAASIIITGSFLTITMFGLVQQSVADLETIVQTVDSQNEVSFQDLNTTTSGVSKDIWDTTGEAAIEQLRNSGEEIAAKIKSVMDSPFVAAREITSSLMFFKEEAERQKTEPNREQIERFLRNCLVRNEELAAVFSCWEKNKFDGKDAEFIGKENPDPDMSYSNNEYKSEGAFLPWFYRGEDEETKKEKIIKAFCDDYLTSSTEYYVKPRDTKEEFITEPYIDAGYPIASFCVPILKDGNYLGMTGIDVSLTQLGEIVKESKPFDDGFAMFVSPGGAIIYHPNKEVNLTIEKNEDGEDEETYQNIDKVEALKQTAKYIAEKKTDIYTSTTMLGRNGEEMLVLHVPVQFGNYPESWTIVIAAPVSNIMKQRDSIKNRIDNMLAHINKSNQTFAKDFGVKTKEIMAASESSAENAFFKSCGIAAAILFLAVLIGIVFANWVSRSIAAKDFRYLQILNALDSPIFVTDMDRNIVFINKKGLEFLGRKAEDCVGKPMDAVWRPVLGEKYETCGIRKLLSGGHTKSMLELHGESWGVDADFIKNMRGSKDGCIEIFNNVTNRERSYHLVERVGNMISVTIKQTSQISGAADSLLRGANEQAESLSSVMTDMTSVNEVSVQTADNTVRVNVFSGDAATAAQQGQQRMQSMVEAMNRISENAKNMQRVIGTIDEIAFQTNLLALNAAVEAARAGSHGKGFAVVAEEVRNLASRSAKAAKETEELIINSNKQIDSGVAVANETNTSLNTITEHITKVSQLISQIAASSSEQSKSVQRITQTLQSVDQITKQNVELASSTNSAVEELSVEMKELKELTGQQH